jgi:hypothetical protein
MPNKIGGWYIIMGDLLDPPLQIRIVRCNYALACFAIHPMAFNIGPAFAKSLTNLEVKSVIHFIAPVVPTTGP